MRFLKPILVAAIIQLSSEVANAQQTDSMSVVSVDPMEDLYRYNSPLDYLKILTKDFRKRNAFNAFFVTNSPEDWVKEGHIDDLMKLIYSTDSTHSVISVFSSFITHNQFSSIGREAQHLIDCFRDKKSYPPVLNSSGVPDKEHAKELETWWADYKKKRT
jgi:hypothetical protein